MKKHLLAVWRKAVQAWYYRVVTPCEVHFLFPLMGLADWLTAEMPDRLKRKQPVLAGAEQLEKRWLMSSGITEYAVPTIGSSPWRLTVGSDNLIWFTENAGKKIAKVTTGGSFTEYGTTGNPWDIVSGPDGNLWFTDKGTTTNYVGKSTTSGSITEYALPFPSATDDPHGIASALGIDGNLWLLEYGGDKVAKVTTSGSVTEYSLTAGSNPEEIVAGPDGKLWFSEKGGNKVANITTSGAITEYTLPNTNSQPHGITVGPDNNIWFTEANGNRIGRITLGGAITEFTTGLTANSTPEGIAKGADGNLWFAEYGANQIGRITTDGTITEYGGLATGAAPTDVVAGPDGAIWWTESGANKIGTFGWVASGSQRTAVPDASLPDLAVYYPFGLGAVSPQTGNLHIVQPLDFQQSVPSGLNSAAQLAGPAALVYNADSTCWPCRSAAPSPAPAATPGRSRSRPTSPAAPTSPVRSPATPT